MPGIRRRLLVLAFLALLFLPACRHISIPVFVDEAGRVHKATATSIGTSPAIQSLRAVFGGAEIDLDGYASEAEKILGVMAALAEQAAKKAAPVPLP